MRPACLRNARSVASAPAPLLPFLAPRAFADAPSIRRYECKTQEEWETKGEGAVLAKTEVFRASIGKRYADIFSFARQQMRKYSTDGVGGRIRRVSVKNGGRVRRNGVRKGETIAPPALFKTKRPGTTIRTVPRRQVRKIISVRGKIKPWSIADSRQYTNRKRIKPRTARPILVAISTQRRRRRLKHLRQTMYYFQRYEASKHPAMSRPDHGKYRSLSRRILSLSVKEPQVININNRLDFTGSSRWSYIGMIFAALDRNVYPGLKRNSYSIKLIHHEKCPSWADRLFNNEDALRADHVWANWSAFDDETREKYWPHLLIFLLDKFPERALSFIEALSHAPCVKTLDSRIIADAFEHLARIYMNERLWKPAQRDLLQAGKPDFVPTFYHVFREHLAPHKRICSQDLLFCVAKLASIEDLHRIFGLLKESDAYMGYDVLLHYANAFANAGEFRQGLACLRIIAERENIAAVRTKLVNSTRFKWSSALILHRSMMDKENYHETTGIVAALVEFGVKLDILLYNVIMHNAMEAGDYATAFKVFNTLDENGLKPDKITFSTLLHGCTMTSDPAQFHEFAEYCAATAKETKDPWLAADYLYYRFVRLHRESNSPEESFEGSELILRVYLEFFSPHPLEPIWAAGSTFPCAGLASLEHVLTDSAPMDPPPLALYIMLQLEIVKASTTSTDHVWSLYLRFMELARTNHSPLLSRLAQNPLIWNTFLLAFCRAKSFAHASQLVHDMSDYGSDPNIYTWNIFMQGFFKAQQIHAAERVFDIMRARGIQPDQFTYEVLLRGYARAQNLRKIGEVLQHVDHEGQVSARLLRELARVHDQKRVVFELEKARVAREEREREQAEAKAEQERAWWAKWAKPKFAPLVTKPKPHDFEQGPKIESLLAPGKGLGPRPR